MNSSTLRLLTIVISLAFWALNAAFAVFLGRAEGFVPGFFLYPCFVAISIFVFEYLRVRREGADPVVPWPNWAAFAFILVPVIAGLGGLIWTFFHYFGASANIMVYALAAGIGVQTAHLANEV